MSLHTTEQLKYFEENLKNRIRKNQDRIANLNDEMEYLEDEITEDYNDLTAISMEIKNREYKEKNNVQPIT